MGSQAHAYPSNSERWNTSSDSFHPGNESVRSSTSVHPALSLISISPADYHGADVSSLGSRRTLGLRCDRRCSQHDRRQPRRTYPDPSVHPPSHPPLADMGDDQGYRLSPTSRPSSIMVRWTARSSSIERVEEEVSSKARYRRCGVMA
jgi:hypothetical protein